jgi:hypothetical protein
MSDIDIDARLQTAEDRLDTAQTVLDEVRKVLDVAEKARAASERARADVRKVTLVVLGSAAVLAVVVFLTRRSR